jgi:hypothetical protein
MRGAVDLFQPRDLGSARERRMRDWQQALAASIGGADA